MRRLGRAGEVALFGQRLRNAGLGGVPEIDGFGMFRDHFFVQGKGVVELSGLDRGLRLLDQVLARVRSGDGACHR